MKCDFKLTWISLLLVQLTFISLSVADQEVPSYFTDMAPTVDGKADDAVWSYAPPVTTKDGAADNVITLRSVHTNTAIYFLVTFADEDESRRHRPWVWNKSANQYEVGPEREDCFVFKWFMGAPPKDHHIDSDEPHLADTWFWKARRTDPVGYADDKIQRLSDQKLKKAMKLKTKSGDIFYLQRKGDRGKPAYLDQIIVDYEGDVVPRFKNRQPTGSRADIIAKGRWENCNWTIEISRKLETGHSDDVQFDITESYVFGVSRYEIAGRNPDYSTTQPFYGAGRLSERLYLRFVPQQKKQISKY